MECFKGLTQEKFDRLQKDIKAEQEQELYRQIKKDKCLIPAVNSEGMVRCKKYGSGECRFCTEKDKYQTENQILTSGTEKTESYWKHTCPKYDEELAFEFKVLMADLKEYIVAELDKKDPELTKGFLELVEFSNPEKTRQNVNAHRLTKVYDCGESKAGRLFKIIQKESQKIFYIYCDKNHLDVHAILSA